MVVARTCTVTLSNNNDTCIAIGWECDSRHRLDQNTVHIQARFGLQHYNSNVMPRAISHRADVAVICGVGRCSRQKLNQGVAAVYAQRVDW